TSLGLSKLGKGEQEQAISDLQMAIKLDAKSSQAGITLVRTELALKHYDKALAAALEMEKAQPDNATVQELKGLVHLAQNEAAQARKDFERALVLQPSHFPAASNLVRMDLAE